MDELLSHRHTINPPTTIELRATDDHDDDSETEQYVCHKKAKYDKSADDQKASQSPADVKTNQPKTPENATRKNQPKMPEISTKKTTNISLMKYLNL